MESVHGRWVMKVQSLLWLGSMRSCVDGRRIPALSNRCRIECLGQTSHVSEALLLFSLETVEDSLEDGVNGGLGSERGLSAFLVDTCSD